MKYAHFIFFSPGPGQDPGQPPFWGPGRVPGPKVWKTYEINLKSMWVRYISWSAYIFHMIFIFISYLCAYVFHMYFIFLAATLTIPDPTNVSCETSVSHDADLEYVSCFLSVFLSAVAVSCSSWKVVACQQPVDSVPWPPLWGSPSLVTFIDHGYGWN